MSHLASSTMGQNHFDVLYYRTGVIDYSRVKSLRQKVDSADSPFVTDPFMRQAFVISNSVPSKLLVLAIGQPPISNISTVKENVIMLPTGPAKNVWNLVVWEGSGKQYATTLLLGVMGERFSTLILQISPSGLATVAKNISIGPPVRNIAVYGAGCYFFLTSGVTGRALVTFFPETGELDHWAHPAFNAMYFLSYDRGSGLLIGTFTVASFATVLRNIDWKARTITDRADFLEMVPTGSLAPYDASVPPGARSIMVRLPSGLTLVSRDTNSTLNLIDVEQLRLTTLSVPGLIGFVLISDVTPQLTSTAPKALMMAGATRITAVGTNFGRKDYVINSSVITRSAVSPAEIWWMSDTSVIVQTPPSSDIAPGPARLTVNFLHGATAIVTGYEQSWTSISPSSAPASGGVTITISGAGFAAGDRYLCNWTSNLNISTQTSGIAQSAQALTCRSPSWAFRSTCEGYTCTTILTLAIVRSVAAALMIVPHREDETPALLIIPGPPQTLVILSGQTNNIRSSAPLEEQYVVAVQDSQGNNCNQGQEYSVQMNLVSCPNNTTTSLGQEQTVAAVLVANDLQLHLSASGCRLKFTVAGVGLTAYSSVLNVIEGFLSNVTVKYLPSILYGGIPFRLEVEGRDMDGNRIHDIVQITCFAEMVGNLNESGVLKGRSSTYAVDGIGMFTDLVLNRAGYYQLFFVASGSPLRFSSNKITVAVGEPAAVRLKWPDRNVFTSMERISPPPVAWTVDAGGNPTTVDLTFYAELHAQEIVSLQKNKTVSVKSNLFGPTEMQAVAGIATFTNLAVSQKLYGYYLVFAVVGIGQAKSDLFTVLPGSASALHIFRQPGSSSSAFILPTQPIVLIRDEGNNTIDIDSRVNVTLPGRPPMHVRGHSSIFAVSGIVRFTGSSSLYHVKLWYFALY